MAEKRDSLDSHCVEIEGEISCFYTNAEPVAENSSGSELQKECQRNAEGVTCFYKVGVSLAFLMSKTYAEYLVGLTSESNELWQAIL